jgi:hypothetical protein
MIKQAVLTKDAGKVVHSAKILRLVVKPATPYTVCMQYTNRERTYVKCETMAQVRETVVRNRKNPKVTYIYFSIPEMDKIDAYDVRDPERYV